MYLTFKVIIYGTETQALPLGTSQKAMEYLRHTQQV